MMTPVKSVDEYLANNKQWADELAKLREILLSTGLKEEIKWNAPIYTFNGKNVAGIAAFKTYAGLWFHQGALLKDEKRKLINAQEGKTKALRQWRFNSIKEIDPRLVKSYTKEAIQNARDGKEIKATRQTSLEIPKELLSALKKDKEALSKFKLLSEGRQREYAEYIHEAVKDETKLKRIAKVLPIIRSGKGLNDRYR